MKRNLKTLWGVALAALAIGAYAAPAASATTHVFHGEVEPIIVTAEQETQFVFAIGELETKCEAVRIAGTAIEEAEEFAVATELEECEFAGLAVAIETAGCTNITSGETDEEEHAHVNLECEEGVSVKVTAMGCTITVPSQELGGGVHFTNVGEGQERQITLEVTEKEIHYTTSGFLCGLIGLPAEGENAQLAGALLAAGYADHEKSGPNPPPYEPLEEQVGIWFE